jgi:hypothetical protein
MTTVALEQRSLIQTAKPSGNWWRTLPGRLLALVRKIYQRMSAIEPNYELHEQLREKHRVNYMHLIHRM